MKPLVIFHADCQDGYGAAFAAWMKLDDEAAYVPVQYGSEKHKFGIGLPAVDGRDVYVLDFSFPRDIMESLFANAKRVVWLDHHKTAFEMWCGKYEKGMFYMAAEEDDPRIKIHLNDNKSGALLAWEYFHPGVETPLLIQHIDDRDRWQWKMEGSAELHAALGSMKPWSFERWKYYVEDEFPESDDVTVDALIAEGHAILRAQKQHVEGMTKQARKCVIRGTSTVFEDYLVGLAVNASIHQSEVGHELANISNTFGLVWYVGSDLRVRCSLRSNGEYDVSAIARSFGGGGHRNAAGFETDIDTLMGWLK